MEWKDLSKFVGGIAPAVGLALGGPAGAIVGKGLAAALGTKPTPADIEQELLQNKDALLKVRQFQQQMGLETLKEELADTQHAREQHHDHWMPSALTIVLAVMVFSMFAGILTFEMSSAVEDIVYLIAGQVLMAFLTCVSFWMGTSRSSQEKTRLIKKE